MDQAELDTLTNIIDNYNYANEEIITPDFLYDKFWNGINRLITDPHKDSLIDKWKYKSEFNSTYYSHMDNVIQFDKLPWEKSFLLHFWMCIYH